MLAGVAVAIAVVMIKRKKRKAEGSPLACDPEKSSIQSETTEIPSFTVDPKSLKSCASTTEKKFPIQVVF